MARLRAWTALASGPYTAPLLLALYLAAHGAVLALSGAAYWDDWIWLFAPEDQVRSMTREGGFPWLGWFFLNTRTWAFLPYRVITLLCYGLSTLLLFATLLRMNADRKTAFWIAAFFALAPFNLGRVMVCVTHYGIANFLFFLAWYCLAEYERGRRQGYRIAASIFFVLSFTTNSFLVFYLVPIVSVFYANRHATTPKRFAKEHFEFLAIPFVFMLFRMLFFKPYGDYEGYNTISLNPAAIYRMLDALLVVLRLSGEEIPKLIRVSFALFVGAVLLRAAQLAWSRVGTRSAAAALWRDARLPLLGLLCMLLALLPYLAVSKIPGFDFGNDRHQLLLPLGWGLFAAGGLLLAEKLVTSRIVAQHLYAAALFALCFVWWRNYYDFYYDWVKEASIVAFLEAQNPFPDRQPILVKDELSAMNAMRRDYDFYDLSGMFFLARGTQDHFISLPPRQPRTGWRSFCGEYSRYFTSAYLMKGVRGCDAAPGALVIGRGDSVKSLAHLPRLLYSQLLDRPRFRREIRDFVSLQYVPDASAVYPAFVARD